jgi:ribulose-phosphate 3-epimerase
MIEPVDPLVSEFAGFENAVVTFHPEASRHPLRTIDAIRHAGARPGIAVDPAQPLEVLKHLLPAVDFVLLMTVNPGYSGQKLVPGALDKIAEFARYRDEKGVPLEIEVDGNVSWENIPKMIDAGADTLVAGTSSLFGKPEERRRDAGRLVRAIGRD